MSPGSITDDSCSPPPENDVSQQGIREQLDRMLASSHFKQSRRYPALLRFIVEETLQGRGDLLKERVLGIEVFKRDASYDTAADPVVRVTIAEVRKRIAQYYHGEAHDGELRIELPAGHYVAEFWPSKETTRVDTARTDATRIDPARTDALEDRGGKPLLMPDAQPVPADESELSAATISAPGSIVITTPEPSSSTLPRSRMLGKRAALWFLLAVCLVFAGRVGYRWKHPSALDELWGPLLQSGKQVLFCVPTEVGRHHGALTTPADVSANDSGNAGKATGKRAVVTFLDHETYGENVVFSDALATVKIANLLALHPREFRIKLNVATTLDDLRQGPVVLIGGLDNQWTLQAIAHLPFRFAGSDDEGYWISDTREPGNHAWFLDLKQEYAKVTRDYALIARVHGPVTGQPQIVVAGIGMSGTMAAGEFVVDDQQIEELRRRIGPGLRDRDFEAVLSTDVVNGVAGAPHILDVWVR